MRTRTFKTKSGPSRERLFDSLRTTRGPGILFVVKIESYEERVIIKELIHAVQNAFEIDMDDTKEVKMAMEVNSIAIDDESPGSGIGYYRDAWVVSGRLYNYKPIVHLHIDTRTRKGKLKIQH